MESIGDLLSGRTPREPEEFLAIKRFIADEFNVGSSVGLQGEALVITVQSASLANALRFRVVALQKAANTTKRIIFRIG